MRPNVKGVDKVGHWGGVKLYHLIWMASINVRDTGSGKCPTDGLGSRK